MVTGLFMGAGVIKIFGAFLRSTARSAVWAALLPLCLMVVGNGIHGTAGAYLSRNIALAALAQLLFPVMAAWLAYVSRLAAPFSGRWPRVVAADVLGILVADWVWFGCLGTFMCLLSNGRAAGVFYAMIGIIAVAPIEVVVLAAPGCTVAAAVGRACGSTGTVGVAGILSGSFGAKALRILAYAALLIFAWLAGSVGLSRDFIDDAPRLLVAIWLGGAALGCAAPLAMLSTQAYVTKRQRGLLFIAALLGFLVGSRILFHLSVYWVSMRWAPIGI